MTQERIAAVQTFTATEAGIALASKLGTSSYVATAGTATTSEDADHGLSAEEVARIRKAIASAGSLEEVARLERQLRGGHVPK